MHKLLSQSHLAPAQTPRPTSALSAGNTPAAHLFHGSWRNTLLSCALLLVGTLSLPAHADAALDDLLAINDDDTAAILSPEDLSVLKALAQAQNSRQRGLTSKPVVSTPNEVRFIYGASNPTLVCSLLHVCDIALEAGENVVDVKVGDSARWMVERSASGSPEGIVEHITVKPTDIGLLSNLRIYTDRRTYNLELKSSARDFMPMIAFSYPQSSWNKFQHAKEILRHNLQQRTTSIPNELGGSSLNQLADLDFAYELSGDKSLLPLRVFNDGSKTYVQMPEHLLEGKLPALVAVNATHMWGADETSMTNYRLRKSSFIIDGVPPHLRLILGNKRQGSPLNVDIVHRHS